MLLISGVPSASAEAPITVGKITAEYRASGGLYLSYDGVPVIRGSLLQVFAKNGQQNFGSGGNAPTVTTEPLSDGGRVIVAKYQDKVTGLFSAEVRTELHPSNTVTLHLTGNWRGTEPAAFEWCAAKMWSYPLEEARWRKEGVDYTDTNGVISPVGKSGDYREAMVAEKFWSLAIDGRAFHFRALPGQDSTDTMFFDGRKSPEDWAQGDRPFWLGYVSSPAPNTGSFTRTIRLTFAPGDSKISTVASVTAKATLVPLAVVDTPEDGPPLIIPQPKEARFTGKDFVVSSASSIAVHGSTDKRLLQAVTEFARDFHLRIAASPAKSSGVVLEISRKDAKSQSRAQEVSGLVKTVRVPENPEGYCLRVGPGQVVIAAKSAQGAFYGLQSLRQLARPAKNETGLRFQGAEIRDWPSLKFRGAHIFTGKNALPFHKKLIERIFSRLKMNELVMECEYTQWATHPEISVNFSMPKRDLAVDIAFAQAHFLEVTPLINSLGHAEWMFKNGQNRNFVEDPEHPAATCPNREATYKFIFDIYNEALALFKPRYFHIGHDEITLFSRFPYHPECKAEGKTQEEAVTSLFLKDIKRLDSWLSARGAKTMLWSDMFLHATESSDAAANAGTPQIAAERRSRLPKDIVVADWHYTPEPKEKYKSLDIFQKAGFPAIATTWYRPENIYGFAQAAIDHKAQGLLQSTWAGYDSSESILRGEFKQFTAFVLAAEYAWSGNKLPPSSLPYRAEEVFKKLYRDSQMDFKTHPGWRLDLSKAYNVALPHMMSGHEGQLNALMLAGKLNPASPTPYPEWVTIPVGRRAGALIFLHTTLYPGASEAVGRYTVTFEDGSSEIIVLREGDQIQPLRESKAAWSADIGWKGKNSLGEVVNIQSLKWRNPRPNLVIKTIEFRSTDPVAAPVLFAITGIDPSVSRVGTKN